VASHGKDVGGSHATGRNQGPAIAQELLIKNPRFGGGGFRSLQRNSVGEPGPWSLSEKRNGVIRRGEVGGKEHAVIKWTKRPVHHLRRGRSRPLGNVGGHLNEGELKKGRQNKHTAGLNERR